MKRDSLYYLIAISKSNSMNIAAEQLFISQPALSMSIKKLEHELDVPLLERNSSGVTLTPIGEKIVEIAESIMGLYREIDEIIIEEKENAHLAAPEHLAIYCTYGINQTVISFMLNELFEITPSFEVIPQHIDLANLSQHFGQKKNEVTLALFVAGDFDLTALPSDIHYQVICSTKMHLLVGQSHHLAQNQTKSISLKHVLPYPLVHYKTRLSPQSAIFDLLKTYGTPNILAETCDSRFYINMIASGKAVGFSPKSLFGFILPTDPVVWIPLQETIRVSFAIFYKDDFSPTLLMRLIALLKKATSTL